MTKERIRDIATLRNVIDSLAEKFDELVDQIRTLCEKEREQLESLHGQQRKRVSTARSLLNLSSACGNITDILLKLEQTAYELDEAICELEIKEQEK